MTFSSTAAVSRLQGRIPVQFLEQNIQSIIATGGRRTVVLLLIFGYCGLCGRL